MNHQEPEMLWFFSDDSNFDQDQKFNRMNDIGLRRDLKVVSKVRHSKFSAVVMVLEVVSNERNVIPSHFFSPVAEYKESIGEDCEILNREHEQRTLCRFRSEKASQD